MVNIICCFVSGPCQSHDNRILGHTDTDNRAPDKVLIFISIMSISSPNPMFHHLLESSHRDDSNKWSNIGFGDKITQVESTEVKITHLIRYPEEKV